jgi:hypothetical protein
MTIAKTKTKTDDELVTGPVLAKRLGLTATSVSRLATGGKLSKASRGKYWAWASVRMYIKSVNELWTDADAYVEVWLEKDALAGVVYPITEKFDVPLMVARGYASLSFLHEAAKYTASLEVPAYIYHLGDFDPSGQDAARVIEQTLCKMAPEAEIYFERLAVMREQIVVWDLPSRPTKTSDSRARGFGGVSVELDAISPGRLRALVQVAIEDHLPPEQYAVLKIAEKNEQRLINGLVGMLKGDAR